MRVTRILQENGHFDIEDNSQTRESLYRVHLHLIQVSCKDRKGQRRQNSKLSLRRTPKLKSVSTYSGSALALKCLEVWRNI